MTIPRLCPCGAAARGRRGVPVCEGCFRARKQRRQRESYYRHHPGAGSYEMVCDCGRPAVASKKIFMYSRQFRIYFCPVCLSIEIQMFGEEHLTLYRKAEYMFFEYT
jgi:hypothetical protein